MQKFSISSLAVTLVMVLSNLPARAQGWFLDEFRDDPITAQITWKKPFPKPGALGETDRKSCERSLRAADLKTDRDCGLSRSTLALTEITLSSVDSGLCVGRDNEIVWFHTTQGLYFCESGRITRAMKTSIGSNGLGKKKEGDRKTPVGSYWLGLPRASEKYGIFIPVGYPNAADVKAKRTGGDVGIHGPLRYSIFFSACSVESSISRNWTAGCISVARDTQIAEIADWVVDHWPVQLHVLAP